MQEIIGSKLPSELYYLMSQSLLSPLTITTLVTGTTIESAPLVDIKEYEYKVGTHPSFVSLLYTSLGKANE